MAKLLLRKTKLAGFVLSTLIYNSANAACDNFTPGSNQTATCNSVAPNPTLTNIAALAASTNVRVDILNGSILNILRTTSPLAVSIDSNSQIMNNGSVNLSGIGGSGGNRGAGLFALNGTNTLVNGTTGNISTLNGFNDGMAVNGAGNTLINNGIVSTQGANSYGMAANSGLNGNTITNAGQVSTAGPDARALSIVGQNGVITNTGNVTTTGSSSTAVYIQGNLGRLVNSGLIHTTGTNAEAVFSNTAGSGFTAYIENQFGGKIISDQFFALRTLNAATTIINAGLLQSGGGTVISGGNGNLSLILQTGSTIIGLANGGAGANTVTLQGSGLINNPFMNFQTLYMQGQDWTWQGTGTFANSYLQTGVFHLESNLTGNVNIAANASLLAGNGKNPAITPYPLGPAVTVTNAGIIDLTNGSSGAMDSLTIQGNYVGADGLLRLQSELNGDNSPSDKLILSGGVASGLTSLDIINSNGLGALTAGNGILVVQGINGGSTLNNSFALNSPVAAGPYEYLLFKGGLTPDSPNNWYLRSSIIPTIPGTLPPPTPGATAQTGAFIPLYRVEAALYSIISPLLHDMNLDILGTFHQRRGEQSSLVAARPLSSFWLRFLGGENKQYWEGDLSPNFDGSLFGFQAGIDLLSIENESDHHNNAGIFAGKTHMRGDVKGFAMGWNNYQVGSLDFDGTTLGLYWTYLTANNGYLDAVVLNTWFDGQAKSTRKLITAFSNNNIAASLEGGYPIALFRSFILEPEAQLIWQTTPKDSYSDLFSPFSFGKDEGLTGRLGLRLQSNLRTRKGLFQPYLRANIWHNFASTDKLIFPVQTFYTENKATALQLGGGIVHGLSRTLSAFVTGDYIFNINGPTERGWGGNAGLKISV